MSTMPVDASQADGMLLISRSSEQWFALLWLLLGALSLVIPATTAFAIESVLAVILIVAAAVASVLALLNLSSPGSTWLFTGSLFVAFLAASWSFFPVDEIFSFSACLAVFFLLQGLLAFRLGYRQQHRAPEAMHDLAANGVVNLFLAVFFILRWPQPAIAIPGVLVGASMISLAFAVWRRIVVD